jgi:uncharacterized membrane protein
MAAAPHGLFASGRARFSARCSLLLLALGLSFSCQSDFKLAPLPADHPASPRAPEALLPAPSRALPVGVGQLAPHETKPTVPEPVSPTPSGQPGGSYVCPMHPEVRQAEQGTCPQCGMRLVKEADDEEQEGRQQQQQYQPQRQEYSQQGVEDAGVSVPVAPEIHPPSAQPGKDVDTPAEPEAPPSHGHPASADVEGKGEAGSTGHHEDAGEAGRMDTVTSEAGAEHGAEMHHHESAGFIGWIGKFHPLTVHFPIAFFLGAALAEFLVVVASAAELSHAARFCLLAAAASGIVAALLGWAHAASADFPPDIAGTVELKRWFGTATAAWMIVTALYSEVVRKRPGRARPKAYWFLLLAGTVLIAITGHLGSVLARGRDYLAW